MSSLPILHEMPHSPYCIPVRRILEAWGVPYKTRSIPPWDRRGLAELTGGAYYQVPILEHEGRIVHETSAAPLALPRYLDREFAGGGLFPESVAGIQEILVGHIESDLEGKGFKLSDPAFTDSIEDIGERTMMIRHKERSFGAGCVERWRAEASALAEDFEQALAPFETRLAQRDWLLADTPVYADFALFGVLGNACHGGAYSLGDHLVHLRRWCEAMENYRAA